MKFQSAAAPSEGNAGIYRVAYSTGSTFGWIVDDYPSARSRIRVVARDAAGLAWYDESAADFTITRVTDTPSGPEVLVTDLWPNVPNPFNPTTHVIFTLAEAGPVDLAIYDASGRLVRRLTSDAYPRGRHAVRWDGRSDDGAAAAAGVYFSRLQTRQARFTRKLVLAK